MVKEKYELVNLQRIVFIFMVVKDLKPYLHQSNQLRLFL